MTWNRPRLARAAVLLAWAGFFSYLWLGGDMVRYLGPRTYWVTAFGALVLGGAGIAQVATARSPGPEPGAGDLAWLGLVLAPIVLALAMPNAELGALAASKKATSGALVSSLVPVPEPAGEVGFREIHFASSSERYAATAGIGPGTRAVLVGFVTHPPDLLAGEFALTRFYVSCCAADAIPYSVAIENERAKPADYLDDTWVRARGILALRGGDLVLVSPDIERVDLPANPYL